MDKHFPTVVVIGGGFAGVQTAKQLRDVHANVVLLDKHNYHLFQPLLYQVATAALSPADIASPIRTIFRKQLNTTVVLAEVDHIDLEKRLVRDGPEEIIFDYLVLATGATHSYFGKDAWETDAPGLKTIDDALTIRKRILLAFEEAEHEADEAARRAKLTFVVIGGGPTGVEMAGALREIAAQDIQCDYRTIDTKTTRVILLQGADRLLPQMHPSMGERAKSDLEKMGVEVRLKARVTGVSRDAVFIGDERLDCKNIVWAAGVQASPLNKTLGVPLDKSGRVIVNPDLSVPGHPRVFVIGDAALVIDEKSKNQVPGLAPAALQMGKHVGRMIADEINGNTAPRRPFKYVDKGTLATIGKAKAVADIRGFRFGGFFAWMLWSCVHVMFLISFRNRVFVMLGWMVDFVFKSREARIITGKVDFMLSRPRMPSVNRQEPKPDFAS